MTKILGLLMQAPDGTTYVVPPPATLLEEVSATLRTPIEAFELGPVLSRALVDDGFTTIGDLVAKSHQELLRVPGLGRKALNYIQVYLKERNLRLRS